MNLGKIPLVTEISSIIKPRIERYIPLDIRNSPTRYTLLKYGCIALLLTELGITIAADVQYWKLMLIGCVCFDVWLVISRVEKYKRLRQRGIQIALYFAFSLYENHQMKTGLPFPLRAVHDICDLDWINSGTENIPIVEVSFQHGYSYTDYPSESVVKKCKVALDKYRNAYLKRRPELQNGAYRSNHHLLEILDVSLTETAFIIRLLCMNTPEAVEYFEARTIEDFQEKNQTLSVPLEALDDEL